MNKIWFPLSLKRRLDPKFCQIIRKCELRSENDDVWTCFRLMEIILRCIQSKDAYLKIVSFQMSDTKLRYNKWCLRMIMCLLPVDPYACLNQVFNLVQSTPFNAPKTSINGFFESIESIWYKLWNGLADFITGKTCRFV